MFAIIRVIALLILIAASPVATGSTIEEIVALRLSGDLDSSLAGAEQLLEATDNAGEKILLHLEIAEIFDRVGLHQNTRPVAEGLANINAAAELSKHNDDLYEANVELAYAKYYYSIEMQDREFTSAMRHANKAKTLFRTKGDLHGEAEAVHRLGLIQFQQRNLDSAAALIDESLRLDQQGGERTFFRGEYERHIGFVHHVSGHPEVALPHYERSLEARIEAGAIDASMFAAITLASVLVDLSRPQEARAHLDYAMGVAERIPSPVGRSRAQRVIDRIDEADTLALP